MSEALKRTDPGRNLFYLPFLVMLAMSIDAKLACLSMFRKTASDILVELCVLKTWNRIGLQQVVFTVCAPNLSRCPENNQCMQFAKGQIFVNVTAAPGFISYPFCTRTHPFTFLPFCIVWSQLLPITKLVEQSVALSCGLRGARLMRNC